jgi:hypothetical protein
MGAHVIYSFFEMNYVARRMALSKRLRDWLTLMAIESSTANVAMSKLDAKAGSFKSARELSFAGVTVFHK